MKQGPMQSEANLSTTHLEDQLKSALSQVNALVDHLCPDGRSGPRLTKHLEWWALRRVLLTMTTLVERLEPVSCLDPKLSPSALRGNRTDRSLTSSKQNG